MDPVFHKFLEQAQTDALELAGKSALLDVIPVPPFPPSTYLCQFKLPYLRRRPDATVDIAPGPVTVGLHFPGDYLRSTDAHLYLKVAAMLSADFVHPNVYGVAMCLGAGFAPGTPMAALLWECYEIVAYQNMTLDERNALNPEACRLLRANRSILTQLPQRTLLQKRSPLHIEVRTL